MERPPGLGGTGPTGTRSLASVRPGERVVVDGFATDRPDAPAPARRLQDLGLVPGTTVGVERRAPLGDPTVYVVRGTRLAIRAADAAWVLVHDAGAAVRTGTPDPVPGPESA